MPFLINVNDLTDVPKLLFFLYRNKLFVHLNNPFMMKEGVNDDDELSFIL